MRILFMGNPDFAVPALDVLSTKHEIVGVVTNPDRPAGRGKHITKTKVTIFAESKRMKILQPQNLEDKSFLKEIGNLCIDLMIVIAFRKVPKAIYSLAPLGAINLHASLLPDYRGAAPINWAIINGEKISGLTTFFLNEDLDCGKIILQKKMLIGIDETFGDMYSKMKIAGAKLLLDTIKKINSTDFIPKRQINSANLKTAPKIFRRNCRIDLNKTNIEVHNFVRGLSPSPCAWGEIKNKTRTIQVKIFKTGISNVEKNATIGSIRQMYDLRLFFCCKKGWLEILEIQKINGLKMSAMEFLNGIQNIDDYHFH